MNILTECNLAQLVVDLLAGKVVVFPTETSYGIGCDATNQDAVDRIFKIKGRRSDKPLLVVVPNVAMAKEYLVWNNTLEKLANTYWPGAVTVVGEHLSLRGGTTKQSPGLQNGSENKGIATPRSSEARNDTLAIGVVSKDHTVAVRVTANELLQSITEKMGRPLVATSANLSDTGDIYDSSAILEQYKDRAEQPDVVLNFGVIPPRKPSTLVSVVGETPQILRQGEVEIEM